MFYSQYILAKKGPLGTIWIAAHLERKLRKNQVTETDIPTSVDSILFPEVPIALRLSGHLLLGVVRIYSRKVNYLFHDCNEALLKLKTAFSSASVDLPPDASRAPFHAITLPEAFDFDDMDLFPQTEDVFYITDVLDQHVTTRDLITLEEPMEDDAYPGSQFEHERFVGGDTPRAMGLGSNEEFLLKRHPTLQPLLQEDVLPPMPMDIDTGPSTSTYSPNFEAEAQYDQSLPKIVAENESPGALANEMVPDVEKLRSVADAVEDELYGFQKEREFQHGGNEPSTLKSPVGERQLVEDDQPMLRTPVSRPALSPTPALSSPISRDNLLSELAGVLDGTPALAVVETPVPKRKTRKRKPTYDLEVQLQSSYMRDLLKHSSDLRRVRKKVAHTQQEIWLSEKERLGKRIFSKPSVHGLCAGLEELYDKMLNAKRPKTASVSSAPRAVRIQSPPDMPEANEQLHTDQALTPGDEARIQEPDRIIAPEVRGENEAASNLPDASPLKTVTDNVDYGTPSAGIGMETPLDFEVTDATRELRSKAAQERLSNRLNMSAETVDIGHDRVLTEEEVIPGVEPDQHADAIDSSLLLESIEPAPVSEGAKHNEGWSARTRAIAEFLRATFEDMEKRPHEEDSPKVSLERLVGGKTRKEAARMFFETLVLRTNNYILTQQEAPYEEIDIYPQATLMKAVF